MRRMTGRNNRPLKRPRRETGVRWPSRCPWAIELKLFGRVADHVQPRNWRSLRTQVRAKLRVSMQPSPAQPSPSQKNAQHEPVHLDTAEYKSAGRVAREIHSGSQGVWPVPNLAAR